MQQKRIHIIMFKMNFKHSAVCCIVSKEEIEFLKEFLNITIFQLIAKPTWYRGRVLQFLDLKVSGKPLATPFHNYSTVQISPVENLLFTIRTVADPGCLSRILILTHLLGKHFFLKNLLFWSHTVADLAVRYTLRPLQISRIRNSQLNIQGGGEIPEHHSE